MIIKNCTNFDEVKEEIKKAFESLHTTIIKMNNKTVAQINNLPNEIHDIFYLDFNELIADTELSSVQERTEKAIKKLGSDTICINHVIPSEVVDNVISAIFKSHYGKGKSSEFSFVPDEPVSLKEFIKYASENFPYDENCIFQTCEVKFQAAEREFTTRITAPISEEKLNTIVASTKVKLTEHLFYRACMTAMELCKYLLHFNMTDVYDGFLTGGINTGEKIYESKGDVLTEIEAYTCSYGIYVEMVKGMISRDVTQIVFIDNDFVRNNISKVEFIDANFIGLSKNAEPNRKLYDLIKNLNYEDKTKEKLAGFSPWDLRFIMYINPEYDQDGNIIFKIGKHTIVRFSPRHEKLIKILTKSRGL